MKAVFAGLLAAMPMLVAAGPTEDLVKRLSAVNSLSGNFEQVVLDRGGTRLQEASGTMHMARGNRFRWHTTEPFEQLAVSNGQLVWIYDVDLEQVIEKPLTQDTASTPALLFGGDPKQVAAAFIVEEGARSGRTVSYLLSPRQDDTLFVELEVTFAGDRPLSMRLEDALGQQTSLDFRDTVVNGRQDQGLFEFTAPDGVDLIRQSE
ncbi:MAG: outer membrane lipoprotein chaperone LolA [Alcanivoracaceae bacterium]